LFEHEAIIVCDVIFYLKIIFISLQSLLFSLSPITGIHTHTIAGSTFISDRYVRILIYSFAVDISNHILLAASVWNFQYIVMPNFCY